MAQWKKYSVSNSVTQTHLSAGFARQIIIKKLNYIYCPRVMLESTFKLVLHWLWSLFDILYTLSPVSQLEWPIIMTKQLLIICEWCSHRLFRSIWVWSWLENLKRCSVWYDLADYEAVRLFLLQCEVVADRENLNWVWICGKSLNLDWICCESLN